MIWLTEILFRCVPATFPFASKYLIFFVVVKFFFKVEKTIARDDAPSTAVAAKATDPESANPEPVTPEHCSSESQTPRAPPNSGAVLSQIEADRLLYAGRYAFAIVLDASCFAQGKATAS